MKNGKYERHDISLLEKVVEHWERDNVGKKRHTAIRRTDEDCALCAQYRTSKQTCFRCPVFVKTKAHMCMNSPYQKVASLHIDWEAQNMKPGRFEVAVALEVLFLKGLLYEAKAQFAKRPARRSHA